MLLESSNATSLISGGNLEVFPSPEGSGRTTDINQGALAPTFLNCNPALKAKRRHAISLMDLERRHELIKHVLDKMNLINILIH